MNNVVFKNTMENVRKQKTTERRRNYLVSTPNSHTTKFSTKKKLALEVRKSQILMKISIYLGLSKLDLSEAVRYDFGMIM